MKFDKSAFNSVVKHITSNLCMVKRETVADHFSSVPYDKQLSVESLTERNRIRLQKTKAYCIMPLWFWWKVYFRGNCSKKLTWKTQGKKWWAGNFSPPSYKKLHTKTVVMLNTLTNFKKILSQLPWHPGGHIKISLTCDRPYNTSDYYILLEHNYRSSNIF